MASPAPGIASISTCFVVATFGFDFIPYPKFGFDIVLLSLF
jgi:hypothetical protein